MSFEDNENFYVLQDEASNPKRKGEEEIEEDYDDSPMNFAAYSNEEAEEEIESEDEEIEKEEGKISRATCLGLLLRIMFDPIQGWKKLRRSGISVEKLQTNCFYPLLAIMALSEFADFFYSVNVNLTQVVTQAVVAFVAFFFGNFCIPVVMSWVLDKETMEKFDTKYGKEYVLIALSTLTIFAIFTNLLPMLWPILIFLPIWTIYLLFKGVRFFLIPKEKEMKFLVLISLAVIGVPLLIDYILNTIMPY